MLYDVIIIGLGPAGLSAAIYGARYNLKTLALGSVLGGAMAEAWMVENYPGFAETKGLELAEKMKSQAEKFGAKIINDEVIKIMQNAKFPAKQDLPAKRDQAPLDASRNKFQIITKNGKIYESRALILALGTQRRKLNIPGEEKFHGHGVAYCATCDGAFFKNKSVAVIGGGDSAVKSALLLSQYADKVYIIVRGESLTGEPKNIDTIKNNNKVEIMYKKSVSEIIGNGSVNAIKLDNNKKIDLSGVFVEIGTIPASTLLNDLKIVLDEQGYIKVDNSQKTNVAKIYAAGDVTNQNAGFKQIIIAASSGAVAVHSAYKDLAK